MEKNMADPRISRLAKLLTNYCVEVKPGDRVLINGGFAALPLVQETYREVIRAGGHPLALLHDESLKEIKLKEANDEQLAFIHDPEKITLETYECNIGIRAAENTRTLSAVDPAREAISRNAGRELMETFMRRSAAGEFRWVGTLFPTNAYAQEADMSLAEFEDFVYGACFVDREDPVAEWLNMSTMQQKLVDWLVGKKEVKVKGPNVDLTLAITERTFINSDGHRNMPSGEIFTGPVEDSVNGWVRFSYPAIQNGREVTGIELYFEDGKIVKATAQKNEAFLHSMLDSDAGSRYLGEFAIGTNNGIDRFTKSILFDEKIGGTIHMAIGAGYPETGSKNNSSVHWDMICDMRDGGKIWVDGDEFYDSGRFLID
jgi:aminopeptidase